ncbi:MAG: hypothetical protein HY078_16000 [Elusimicrobia bacterium]|nr:hypothetical protein [Elusimicrobiota bacterium]
MTGRFGGLAVSLTVLAQGFAWANGLPRAQPGVHLTGIPLAERERAIKAEIEQTAGVRLVEPAFNSNRMDSRTFSVVTPEGVYLGEVATGLMRRDQTLADVRQSLLDQIAQRRQGGNGILLGENEEQREALINAFSSRSANLRFDRGQYPHVLNVGGNVLQLPKDGMRSHALTLRDGVVAAQSTSAAGETVERGTVALAR